MLDLALGLRMVRCAADVKAKRAKLEGRGHCWQDGYRRGEGSRHQGRERPGRAGNRRQDPTGGFVADHAASGAAVYTDDAKAYRGMPFKHGAVKHSVGEYVRDMAHTNGIESVWSMLKRAHKKISPKHLDRYVQEFAAKHNIRDRDTIDQINAVVADMEGQ